MEGRKGEGGSIEDDEQLALVKAASAWAWYRRRKSHHHHHPKFNNGATSDEKRLDDSRALLREDFLIEYEDHEYLPSRKPGQQGPSISLSSSSVSVSSVSSVSSEETVATQHEGVATVDKITLLDSYEIQRISRQLDVYIKSSRDHYYKSSLFVTDSRSGSDFDSKPKPPRDCTKLVVAGAGADTGEKKFINKFHLDGFRWSSSVPCCSRRDLRVVEAPTTRSKMENNSRSLR